MSVDVHQRDLLDPAEVLLWHDLHVDNITIILSVGDQGGPATIIHPPSSLDWLTAAPPHDVFVIALEADQFQVGRSPVHQHLDDLAALRPTIDIIAEGNDCRRSIRLRVLNDLRYHPTIIVAHDSAIELQRTLRTAAWTPQRTTFELIEIETVHKPHLLFR
jgi:hypothetical protein